MPKKLKSHYVLFYLLRIQSTHFLFYFYQQLPVFEEYRNHNCMQMQYILCPIITNKLYAYIE